MPEMRQNAKDGTLCQAGFECSRKRANLKSEFPNPRRIPNRDIYLFVDPNLQATQDLQRSSSYHITMTSPPLNATADAEMKKQFAEKKRRSGPSAEERRGGQEEDPDKKRKDGRPAGVPILPINETTSVRCPDQAAAEAEGDAWTLTQHAAQIGDSSNTQPVNMSNGEARVSLDIGESDDELKMRAEQASIMNTSEYDVEFEAWMDEQMAKGASSEVGTTANMASPGSLRPLIIRTIAFGETEAVRSTGTGLWAPEHIHCNATTAEVTPDAPRQGIPALSSHPDATTGARRLQAEELFRRKKASGARTLQAQEGLRRWRALKLERGWGRGGATSQRL
jgi:hypothetical protein